MGKEDYYEILGVSSDASADEIKKAYRRLALEFHPDRCGNDEAAVEKFKKIREAYDVLSDPLKKHEYDLLRRGGLGGGSGGLKIGGFHFDTDNLMETAGKGLTKFFTAVNRFAESRGFIDKIENNKNDDFLKDKE